MNKTLEKNNFGTVFAYKFSRGWANQEYCEGWWSTRL
jgi:hypothetical protein